MKTKLKNLWLWLSPAHGVIYFMVILAICHFFWKFTVTGEESDTFVTFFGLDISAPFNRMTEFVTANVARVLSWLGIPFHLHETAIVFPTNNGIHIVWGCNGLKQMYIFFCIIAFYCGSWKHKLWYIPAGLVMVHLFNIFRLVIISVVVKDHPEYFNFLHAYLFKYLFYGFIFLMWVLWEERFARK
ncbi:MAG: exosortase/archaeosortase family protein [Prevotellaceae bacterium]|jgi:exosortase family protein XrtF|nr:exosortase/archaeosortase family protein [Prevotellaceae bacterium]